LHAQKLDPVYVFILSIDSKLLRNFLLPLIRQFLRLFMNLRLETILVINLLSSLILFLLKLLSLELEAVEIEDFKMVLYSGDLQISDTELLLFIVETDFHWVRLHH